MIRCPHCEETGCDGRCRFRLGRRGFIGLALGALASAFVVPRLPDLGNYTEIIVSPFGYTPPDALGPLYAGGFVAIDERCKENRAALAAYDWFNKPLYRRS